MSADIIHLRAAPVAIHPMRFAPTSAQRFDLRGWADGYAIYDGGELIATFHGPQYDLAARTLKALREDASRSGAA